MKAESWTTWRQRGISYVEVLVATLVITISLIPAMDALTVALHGSQISAEQQRLYYHVQQGFEHVLAESFDALDAEAVSLANATTPSSLYSDAAGSADRRLVFLQRYDADNADADGNPFSGGDEGILWIRVALDGASLARETLVSEQ